MALAVTAVRAGRFGHSAAVLAGDLALAWADDLMAETPLAPGTAEVVRRLWSDMRTEMVAGQYLDVQGQITEARSLPRVLRAACLKSALYSVERPLALGAAVAGADRVTLRRLGDAGRCVGMARSHARRRLEARPARRLGRAVAPAEGLEGRADRTLEGRPPGRPTGAHARPGVGRLLPGDVRLRLTDDSGAGQDHSVRPRCWFRAEADARLPRELEVVSARPAVRGGPAARPVCAQQLLQAVALVRWAPQSGSRAGAGVCVSLTGARMMRQLVRGAVTAWARTTTADAPAPPRTYAPVKRT
ncbi:hypothetical protein GCM10010236_81550 [Streptomyces eurythermus]|nr:hypothetical protein GCM10010236_81550 [Streptomyces eurythermus]